MPREEENGDALFQAAHRSAAADLATDAMRQARTRLLLNPGKSAGWAFFATMALQLEMEPTWTEPRVQGTAGVDGRVVAFDPDFINSLGSDERVGLWAHEVGHLGLLHHVRRGDRNLEDWNEACDLSLNPMVRDSGLKLPGGGIFPGEGKYSDFPVGLSAEEYYSLIQQKKGQQGNQPQGGQQGQGPGQGQGNGGQGDDPGEGNCDPGGSGGVIDCPGDPAEKKESEGQWKLATAQAAQVAKGLGELPGSLQALVDQVSKPKIDPEEVLRQFMLARAKNDYSWSKPNRRYISQGIVLPSLDSEALGTIVILVDGSGSCWDPEIMAKFAGWVQGVLELAPLDLTLIYHDEPVQHVDTWQPGNGPLTITPHGGGGTDHRPAFRYIEEQGLDPVCVIGLTDLETRFPAPPTYPVLWCTVGGPRRAPFGTVLPLD